MIARELIYRAIYKLSQLVLPSRDPYILPESNPLKGYRCYAGEVEFLSPIARPAELRLSKTVLQAPGLVEVGGSVFDLRQDGVYRFYRLPTLSEQRIVCTGGINSLLQAVGYLLGYGNDDDKASESALLRALAHRRVIAGCGQLASVSQSLLCRLGISSRIVTLMTLDSWGGQDDGHTLLEIGTDDGKWFLYDPSFGVCFHHNGRRLSALEFSNLRNERLEIERLPTNPGYSRFSNPQYDYDFWIGARMLSTEALLDWYNRVRGLAFVEDKGLLFCPRSLVVEGDEQRISSRYMILSDEEFRMRFYP